MTRRLIVVLLLTLCTLLSGVHTAVEATTITYTATDLNDALGPGGDVWEYRYTVSGRAFAPDMGFSVLFTLGFYSDLQALPVNGDWDVVVFQPDPGLPDDGFYDALALVPDATLTDPFVARFVWLGGGSTVPGAQAFVVYTLESGGVLQVVERGQTIPSGSTAVPEPGTLALASLGLAALVLLRGLARCWRGSVSLIASR